MSESTISKPNPTPTEISAPFWDAARNHQLVIQRCEQCKKMVFYPRLRCSHCWSDKLQWAEVSGEGVVASYTIVYRPGHPAFIEETPYIIALIDLIEGVRLLSNVLCPIDQIQIGLPVNVIWVEQGDFTLPKFQLSDSKVREE